MMLPAGVARLPLRQSSGDCRRTPPCPSRRTEILLARSLTGAVDLDGPIHIQDANSGPRRAQGKIMSAAPEPRDLRLLLDQADAANQRRKSHLDQLNLAIAKFEEALNSREFGIAASVVIDDGDLDDPDYVPGYEQHLAYRRAGKVWALLVEEYDFDERKHSARLATCSEEVRRRAAGGFIGLLTKIVAEIEAGDRKLKEEVKHVESLVDVVQRGQS